MSKLSSRCLLAYLLLSLLICLWMTCTLWAAHLSGPSEPLALEWKPLGSSTLITRDLQLLLIVLFTGAFGACVYSLKSLANYRGDHHLYESWCMFYIVQPFQGASIAYLMYLVIRGGFLSGAGAEKTVNPFGVSAIAGLAGAFSDVAYLKLREVFVTLFKPRDTRGGKA